MAIVDSLLNTVGAGFGSREEMYANGLGACQQLHDGGWLKDPILDYGAGLGRMAVPLIELGYDVIAWDDDPQMRDSLRALGVFVDRPSRNYATAVCCYVLQHQSEATAKAILQVLAAYCHRLIFTAPTFELFCGNPPPNYVRLAEKQDRLTEIRSAESWIVAESEIAGLLDRTGFDSSTLAVAIPRYWTVMRISP